MMRLFSYATGWLWLLIAATIVLLSGDAVGVQWPLSPKVSFGRLLVHPWVAAIEVLLATMLIFLARFDYRYKKRIVIGFSALAVACALYHMFYYLIGIEFLLMYGAGSLIRENSKDA